jgi:chemotaxis regulatin CheY-phosphate phosphatase CheZ
MMADETRLAEDDYRELEAFVARTPRGRAFLAEHTARSRVVSSDTVMAAIGELKDAWKRREAVEGTAARVDALRHELQDMSASIAQARREIAAIRPKDGNDRITTAANELDAIVLSTERASIEILGAAERILEASEMVKAAGADSAPVEIIQNEVTNIFTACSFQDLTGQRTTKVVNALRYIEQRILKLMDLWGVDGLTNHAPIEEPVDKRPDAHLLNGPSDDGIGQNDIDALLNGDAVSQPAPKPVEAAPPPRPAAGPAAAEEAELPKLDQSSIDDLFA